MSNFLPKHKDSSSRLKSGASAALEPESASESTVEQQGKNPPQFRRLFLKRCRQGARLTINGLKQVSSTLTEQFTGPRKLHRRPLFWVGIGVSGSVVALAWGWQTLERSVPDSTADILTYVRDNTLTIKASDGEIIQQIGPATRERLKIWEVPEPLIEAFVATEDRRFEKHSGVDFQGIFRAAFSNLLARGVVEGGSTITQQLARIVYFDQERSLARKLKEMRMAQKIEHDIDKEQILERYLNLVYLGSGAYGIADAAWVYFSKPVKELTLPEMAMLAGLPPAPSAYSPFVNEKAAKERRDTVLQRMHKSGYINENQMQQAIAAPLTTKRGNPKRLDQEAYYFTEYVQQELPKYVPKNLLGKKGLIVETTLNLDWQQAAEAAVQKTIERNGRYERFEQAALVAIDPRNGQIKAMVGGKDFYDQDSNNYLNRVTQTKRQPGSTFKTFVYTSAVAAGISPNSGYLDAAYVVDGYEPKNYSEDFRGWTSIRQALVSSINVIAVKTLIDVGWEPTIEIAKKMGIESKLHSTYSLALGASEVNLLELTSAYGTLAAQGVHTQPSGIRRILDHRGKVIYEQKIHSHRAIDKETAAIMTWMLQGVVTSGTGRSAQLDRPVAGKTGTSDEARDLWFIGYIPQVVAGVWLGNDDNKPTWGASSTAASTWRRFMDEVVEDVEKEPFPERPSKLEGRKATIKAKPIRPKRAIHKKTSPSESGSQSGRRTRTRVVRNSTPQNQSGSSRSYRRRRSNSSVSNPQPAPVRRSRSRAAVRSSTPTRRAAPRNTAPRRSAPAQQTTRPVPSAPKPAAAPAPRVQQQFKPAPAAAPLAPPAARKAPASAPQSRPPEPPAPRTGE
ncbi:PBP1A family penicillin-binding protein [Lyngbya aestuarii]|uniref:PBP1A family penicillin-binding protein n=1 Tax=Lyngbya aestuarii TaxID=118322 RepID=UPI00403E30E5